MNCKHIYFIELYYLFKNVLICNECLCVYKNVNIYMMLYIPTILISFIDTLVHLNLANCANRKGGYIEKKDCAL